jgi:mono/diheme cytochrome c family protein
VRTAWAVPGIILLLTLTFCLSACPSSRPRSPVERGRQIYLANCITCHNPDPTKRGGSGPEIAGAPRELIEARVLRAGYPPGYTPKRTTKSMIALPHLAPVIDDLAAFLAAAQQNTPQPG